MPVLPKYQLLSREQDLPSAGMKPVVTSGCKSEHVELQRYTLMSVFPNPSQLHENEDVEE